MTDTKINITSLLDGESQALREFAQVATGWVYNVIYSYVGNKEDAEEVTQDCLLAVLDALKGFRNQSSLKTWMYSIAINKSKDFLKYKTRQKRSAHIVSIDADYSDAHHITNHHHPGIQLESKEKMDLLFAAINHLPENQKTAIVLAKIDKMSLKEIAVLLETTPKAVESLLSRGKKNLQKYLEAEEIQFYKKNKRV